jgi:hypothetical protein
MTIVADNGPAGQAAVQIMKPALAAAGISMHVAQFPVGSSSLEAPLVAAGASSTDVISVIGTPAECIQYQKTAQQLNLAGKPTLSTAECLDPSLQSALGSLPQWGYVVAANAFDTSDPQVALYLSKVKQYKGAAYVPDAGGYGITTFSAALALDKFLNAASAGGSPATAATVAAAIKGYHGAVFLGPTSLHCGAYAAQQELASCVNANFIQTFEGGSTWKNEGTYGPPS